MSRETRLSLQERRLATSAMAQFMPLATVPTPSRQTQLWEQPHRERNHADKDERWQKAQAQRCDDEDTEPL
ncbi:hypothetical protein GCM10022402_09340 [Salinactinospora qingdaonensis]|uniref:Uncharacterized protein n=1 Tax=Salinactinospora qingdaonensis TaxID=702744 RepID=A0ABP7F5P4_9ACTN